MTMPKEITAWQMDAPEAPLVKRTVPVPALGAGDILVQTAEPAVPVRRASASGARDDGTYKIQPNDTYWAISEKVYGTGGYFRALVELNRDKVEQAFRALKRSIPQIAGFEWGTNVSKEQKDKGFTHCFILTFKSQENLDAYIVHPEHKAFGKILGPVLEDVFVVDFWAKD